MPGGVVAGGGFTFCAGWPCAAATAKIAALKSHTVDIISDFYNEHDLKVIEFDGDLGYVNWKDIGLNPYGNSLIVSW